MFLLLFCFGFFGIFGVFLAVVAVLSDFLGGSFCFFQRNIISVRNNHQKKK